MFPTKTSKIVIYHVLLEFVLLAMNVSDVLIGLRFNETSNRIAYTAAIEDRLGEIFDVLLAQYWLRINDPNSGMPDESRACLTENNITCPFGYFMDFIVAATMRLLSPWENSQFGYLVDKVLQDTASHTEGGREAWDTFQLERSRRGHAGPLLSTEYYRPPEFSGPDIPARLLEPAGREVRALLQAALDIVAESSSEEREIRDDDELIGNRVNVDTSEEQDEEYLNAVVNEASASSQTARSNAPAPAQAIPDESADTQHVPATATPPLRVPSTNHSAPPPDLDPHPLGPFPLSSSDPDSNILSDEELLWYTTDYTPPADVQLLGISYTNNVFCHATPLAQPDASAFGCLCQEGIAEEEIEAEELRFWARLHGCGHVYYTVGLSELVNSVVVEQEEIRCTPCKAGARGRRLVPLVQGRDGVCTFVFVGLGGLL